MLFYAYWESAYDSLANFLNLLMGDEHMLEHVKSSHEITANSIEEAFKLATGNELSSDDPWRAGNLLAADFSEGKEGIIVVSNTVIDNRNAIRLLLETMNT